MNDTCNHSEAEKDTAIFDGICPLCLRTAWRKEGKRAAELEAENKRLREALGEIIFKCGLAGMGNVSGLEITTMAQKALKGGDL